MNILLMPAALQQNAINFGELQNRTFFKWKVSYANLDAYNYIKAEKRKNFKNNYLLD